MIIHNGDKIELRLEQHRYDLCRSTLIDIFSIANTTVLHNLQICDLGSDSEEHSKQKAGYMQIFNCTEGWCP